MRNDILLDIVDRHLGVEGSAADALVAGDIPGPDDLIADLADGFERLG